MQKARRTAHRAMEGAAAPGLKVDAHAGRVQERPRVGSMGTARIETRARKRTQPPRFLTGLPTKKETIECKWGGSLLGTGAHARKKLKRCTKHNACSEHPTARMRAHPPTGTTLTPRKKAHHAKRSAAEHNTQCGTMVRSNIKITQTLDQRDPSAQAFRRRGSTRRRQRETKHRETHGTTFTRPAPRQN